MSGDDRVRMSVMVADMGNSSENDLPFHQQMTRADGNV